MTFKFDLASIFCLTIVLKVAQLVMKRVLWDPAAKKVVRSFSLTVRKEIGALLLNLQKGHGLGMPQSRPLSAVHKSAFELRVRDRAGTYRVIYVLYAKDEILIPHAFTKKSHKTPKKEIQIARKRVERLIHANK